MTPISLITDLHRANHWANKNLLELITEDLFIAETKGSYPSIKAIFTHIWDAQSIWYSRMIGDLSNQKPSSSFEGNHQQLCEAILKSSENLVALLESKTDAYLTENLHYTNLQSKEFNQPMYELLLHLTHHGAYHRGQVVTLLRQLGYTGQIPQTDVVAWYRLQG